jgi:dTDP-4-amino-4,6-dideoxygalactose transaminase
MLRALDIGPGDEVILPPYTFIATATAVLMVGATPVFADVDPRTNSIDPDAVERSLSPRTKAIIPVHIAGIPADMDRLVQIGEGKGVPILEDAAQAHGSEWRGAKLGTLGRAASFSFQLSKNMSAGEGGAIVTGDSELAERMWSIHHVGRRKDGLWYGHYEMSSNYRMTDWQAGVLSAQLSRLDRQIDRREDAAAQLNGELAEIDGISVFTRDPRATRVTHHLYMFRYDPDSFDGIPKSTFVKALGAEGIPCSEGYVEIQKQPLFSHPSVRRIVPEVDFAALSLPGAELACRRTVWIGQNALLDGARGVRDIVRAIKKVCENIHELKEY